MKNYEVKAVLKTTDENGKELKKTELYLVLDAETCSDAEYRVMSEKDKLNGFECEIVSSKESKLIYTEIEDQVNHIFFKVITKEVIVNDEGKCKILTYHSLVNSDSLFNVAHLFNDGEVGNEITSISKSRIVEIIAKDEE